MQCKTGFDVRHSSDFCLIRNSVFVKRTLPRRLVKQQRSTDSRLAAEGLEVVVVVVMGGGLDRSGGRDRLKQRHKWQGDGHKPFVTHARTHARTHTHTHTFVTAL